MNDFVDQFDFWHLKSLLLEEGTGEVCGTELERLWMLHDALVWQACLKVYYA